MTNRGSKRGREGWRNEGLEGGRKAPTESELFRCKDKKITIIINGLLKMFARTYILCACVQARD